MTSYPGVFIPSIHKSSKSKPEEKGLLKREITYSTFLNNVVSNPLLRTCNCLLMFLKETDLKPTIKSFKKIEKIKDLSSVKTLEGEISSLYDDCIKEYDGINLYLTKADKILIELLEKFKTLIVDSIKLSESIKMYSGIIEEIENENKKIGNHVACIVYEETKKSLLN